MGSNKKIGLSHEMGLIDTPSLPTHSRSVYDPTRMILAISYTELAHMIQAKDQPKRSSGSGEVV